MKSSILLFLKKSNHRITKNYRGIILTTIVAKVYNQSYPTWNWEKSEEKSERLSEKLIHNLTDSDSQIIEGVHTKKF